MKKTQLKAPDVIKRNNGGFTYFKTVFPHLQLREEDTTKCYGVDSPFHNEKKGTLNIGLYKGIWQYYDNGGHRYHGDVLNFIARTHGLNEKTNEFYKILEIVDATSDQQGRLTQNESAARVQTPVITYAPDYLTKILFKQYFGKICGDLPPAQFTVKLVDKAHFTTNAGDRITLGSDLVKNKLSYFSFSNAGLPGEIIYSPNTEELHHVFPGGHMPVTFVFGWYESLYHMNFSCPMVAGNLIITNSIENTLLIQSLGFPAICVTDSDKAVTEYLLKVVLPQCPNTHIFFDRSPHLQAAAEKLSKATNIPIIEFSSDLEDYVEQYESENMQVFPIWWFHKQVDAEHIGEYLNSFMKYLNI